MSAAEWIALLAGVWFVVALVTALPIVRYLARREQDGEP